MNINYNGHNLIYKGLLNNKINNKINKLVIYVCTKCGRKHF